MQPPHLAGLALICEILARKPAVSVKAAVQRVPVA